jgi:hypothetical protein
MVIENNAEEGVRRLGIERESRAISDKYVINYVEIYENVVSRRSDGTSIGNTMVSALCDRTIL